MTIKNFTEINKESIQKEFGERLTQLRRQKNYSQEKLALESNVARSYLSGVERGKRNISLINIHILANTLDVPASMLLEKPETKAKIW